MKKHLIYILSIITICNAMNPERTVFVWEFYDVLAHPSIMNAAKTIIGTAKKDPLTGIALANPSLHRRLKKNIHKLGPDSSAAQASRKHWHLENRHDEIRKLINNHKLDKEMISLLTSLKDIGYKHYLVSTMQRQSHELLEDKYPEAFELFDDSLLRTEDRPRPRTVFFRHLRKGIKEVIPGVDTIIFIDCVASNITAANQHRTFKGAHFKSPQQLKAFILDQCLADASDHHILLAEPSDE